VKPYLLVLSSPSGGGKTTIARRLLQSRRLSNRLIAVSTLGHLRDRDSWEVLVRMMGDEDGLLSLAAARALTRIDHTAALPVILPLAPLTVMEGRPLETVIGYDFLQRYRIEIDYAGGRLRLFSPSIDTVRSGATEIPVEFDQNTPRIKGKVEIEGIGVKDVTMMLDTGASTAATRTSLWSSA
jgi:hypothetical protein